MLAAHCCLSSSNVHAQLSLMKMLLTLSGFVYLLRRSCFKTQNLLSPVYVVADYVQQRLCILQVQTQTGKILQLLSQGRMPQKAAGCHSASVASINCSEEKPSNQSKLSYALLQILCSA